MKNVFGKLRQLGHKAVELQRAVDAAPARAAQLREAVLHTRENLETVRLELQQTVQGLRADTSTSLAEALVELDANLDAFERAGHELVGIDFSPGLTATLSVRLRWFAPVEEVAMKSLLREYTDRKTVHTVLTTLRQAGDMAESLSVTGLHYDSLTVELGLTPRVQLHWRPVEATAGQVATAIPTPTPQPPGTAPAPTTPVGALAITPGLAGTGYGQGSFFERRSTPPPPARPAAVRSEAAADPTLPVAPPDTPPASDWRHDALARFKKMPDLNRR